jgi:hypothetical protein
VILTGWRHGPAMGAPFFFPNPMPPVTSGSLRMPNSIARGRVSAPSAIQYQPLNRMGSRAGRKILSSQTKHPSRYSARPRVSCDAPWAVVNQTATPDQWFIHKNTTEMKDVKRVLRFYTTPSNPRLSRPTMVGEDDVLMANLWQQMRVVPPTSLSVFSHVFASVLGFGCWK